MHAKKRRVYWLCDNPEQQHRDKALALNSQGFDVKFFINSETLFAELRQHRAGIFVIGDEGPVNSVRGQIRLFSNHPEVQGARLILSLSQANYYTEMLASCGAFRDIIPLTLDVDNWVQRFSYATGGRAMKWPEPTPQVALNAISAVSMPARIVWASQDLLRIESRIRPQPGSVLQITGAFPAAMGLKSLSVTVMENLRTNLRFRFSDALIASWSVPSAQQSQASQVYKQILASDQGPLPRIFLAVQTSSLRSQVLSDLGAAPFDITTALQKQSIIDEPRYFGPNLVMIEDVLCIGDNRGRFVDMLAILAPGVPVVVLGTRIKHAEAQGLDSTRPIHVLARPPANLSQTVMRRYLGDLHQDTTEPDTKVAHIPAEHELSYCQIHMPARMTQLHPSMATLSIPHEVGPFGMCRIENPIVKQAIGRNPFAKVLQVTPQDYGKEPTFSHSIKCIFSDISESDVKLLGKGLIDIVSEKLSGNVVPLRRTAPVKAASQPLVESTSGGLETSGKVNSAKSDPPAALIAVQQAKPEVEYDPITLDDVANVVAEAATTFVTVAKDVAGNRNLRLILGYVAFLAFSITIIYLAINYLSDNWEQSGGNYTESLKKFAPQKFNSGQGN